MAPVNPLQPVAFVIASTPGWRATYLVAATRRTVCATLSRATTTPLVPCAMCAIALETSQAFAIYAKQVHRVLRAAVPASTAQRAWSVKNVFASRTGALRRVQLPVLLAPMDTSVVAMVPVLLEIVSLDFVLAMRRCTAARVKCSAVWTTAKVDSECYTLNAILSLGHANVAQTQVGIGLARRAVTACMDTGVPLAQRRAIARTTVPATQYNVIAAKTRLMVSSPALHVIHVPPGTSGQVAISKMLPLLASLVT